MLTKPFFALIFALIPSIQINSLDSANDYNILNKVELPNIRQINIFPRSNLCPTEKNTTERLIIVSTAGLRTILKPKLNTLYKTTDLGSGEWVYDPTHKTSSDNTGTITVVCTARFKRVYVGAAQPEWFGVKGDGITDDTEAMQLAVSNGTNKSIVFRAGATYIISGTLELPLGCKIEGNHSKIINNITGAKQLFHIVHSNCSISDITIQNNVSTSNPNGDRLGSQLSADVDVGDAHNFNWINNIKISGIKISGGIDHTTAIVAADGMVENVLVENCTVNGSFLTDYHAEWNNPTGKAIRSPHNIKFINCAAINNRHPSGQSFYIAGAYNVTLLNCKAADVMGGIYLSNGDRGVEPGKKVKYIVKHCDVIRYSDYGMTIIGTDLANASAWYIGSNIDNCRFEGANVNPAATTTGIRIYKNGGGIKITNCVVKNSNTGITVTYSSGSGIIIDHNVFDHINRSAIGFSHVSNSTISNNTFRNTCTIEKNTVFDVTILLSYSSNHNVISNNTFGYPGQTITPYFHIHALSFPSQTDLSVNNTIINNTFYPTGSKIMINNGDPSAGSYQKMVLSGNKIITSAPNVKLVSGASATNE
jgi:hypothetical protein